MARTTLDKPLETVIGYTLRIGVVAAAVLVLTGGVYYLIENAGAAVDYHTFHPAAKHSLDLSAIVQNALALNSFGIIQLGLLVLVATPIVRVMFSVIAFALERDLLYVAVTVIVLAVLLYSFLAKGT
jgi:uncharacterized membrane protein